MKSISVRILFACFIVIAGLIAMFVPSGENIVMFCLGTAAGYIAPKQPVPVAVPAG